MGNFHEDDYSHDFRDIAVQRIGMTPVIKGDFHALPRKVKTFVTHCAQLMSPRGVFICDGSQEEADEIINKLVERGTLTRLKPFNNNYLCCTDPLDVARVESKTFIVTSDKYDSVPHVKPGVVGYLGQWMSPEQMKVEIDSRFPNCMNGRMMLVIPFSMGPVGSPLSKIGIQVTDSSYVLLSMRIMTRVGLHVLEGLKEGDFVKCVHSVGCPRPMQRQVRNHWLCNAEKVLVAHFPRERTIKSFGSGYGGNSLLGKKCFALRIASVIARDEGWLAEHMMIMSITTPDGRERFIAAAFPSACGKTNLAMMKPALPGYKVQCLGDDIAWMRFNEQGELRAINPEAGFFGVAPGTNTRTNPHAMATIQQNTIFTNVAQTEDGHFFWQGLEAEVKPDTNITTWLGQPWRVGDQGKPAHPNSRFAAPASQCPIIHPRWEDPEGVPISAILFGGRRPQGVPLVYEAKSWAHGVMMGACIKSEATAAAEHKGKKLMHDPMAMRPFLGYNFGQYLQHWLSLEQPGRTMPKIFHVNWFRLDGRGKFLWPGFGENIRVLDWILSRCDGDHTIVANTPIGGIPKPDTINMSGLPPIQEEELFSIPAEFWLDDTRENKLFLQEQVGIDTPALIKQLLNDQEAAFVAISHQQANWTSKSKKKAEKAAAK